MDDDDEEDEEEDDDDDDEDDEDEEEDEQDDEDKDSDAMVTKVEEDGKQLVEGMMEDGNTEMAAVGVEV